MNLYYVQLCLAIPLHISDLTMNKLISTEYLKPKYWKMTFIMEALIILAALYIVVCVAFSVCGCKSWAQSCRRFSKYIVRNLGTAGSTQWSVSPDNVD
jgi:hypothetical protein